MKELRAWVGEGLLNTDDNALVEFEGPPISYAMPAAAPVAFL